MISVRFVTLSAVVMLGFGLLAPASEAAARGAGQPAVKASRLSAMSDDATKDLRDLVKDIDKNRRQKSNIR